MFILMKPHQKVKTFLKSDKRILGDSDFVEQVLSETKEQMDKKHTGCLTRVIILTKLL